MSTTSTVPVTITPEAAEHIARLGYQREFEEMLEHTLQTVPRVRRLEVSVQHDPEGEDIPAVMIHPILAPGPNDAEDRYDSEWGWWKINTYTRQVAEHFVMITFYDDEPRNGR